MFILAYAYFCFSWNELCTMSSKPSYAVAIYNEENVKFCNQDCTKKSKKIKKNLKNLGGDIAPPRPHPCGEGTPGLCHTPPPSAFSALGPSALNRCSFAYAVYDPACSYAY